MLVRVIDTRGNAFGVHKCSISFQRRPRQYNDMLRTQLSPPEEVSGLQSMPETGRLVCTNAVPRFRAARDSIPICYAGSERRPGKCSVRPS